MRAFFIGGWVSQSTDASLAPSHADKAILRSSNWPSTFASSHLTRPSAGIQACTTANEAHFLNRDLIRNIFQPLQKRPIGPGGFYRGSYFLGLPLSSDPRRSQGSTQGREMSSEPPETVTGRLARAPTSLEHLVGSHCD